ARLGEKRSAQFNSFRAPGPTVQEFAFDLQLAFEDGQLGGRRRLIDHGSIVDRNPRLQVRDVDESGTQIFSKTLNIFRPLTDGASGPRLQSPKNKNASQSKDQYHQGQCHWPGNSAGAR